MLCTRTTKAGRPCPHSALSGEDHCLAHAPAELREAKGFGGPQEGAGRPPNPRVVDVLRELLEDELRAEVVEVLRDALGAERVVVVGSGENAEMKMVPDWQTRLAASREWLDRAYGKPKQATEVSGPERGPIPMPDITNPEVRRLAHELLSLQSGHPGRVDRNDSPPAGE